MPAPAAIQRRGLLVPGAIAAICTLATGRTAAHDVSGVDSFAFPLTNLRMIYDTGASGVILFEGPALALSIPVAQFMGTDVVFADVGVGGSTTFGVSDPIHMSTGNFVQDPPDPYTSHDVYLSALSGFPVPFREGPFEWVVLDLAAPTPTLGVIFPAPAPVPISPALHLVATGILGVLGARLARARTR